MKNNEEYRPPIWCYYCKSDIAEGEPFTRDNRGRPYHPYCYVQCNTFTNEYGETSESEYDA
jgi:hypothetical protein